MHRLLLSDVMLRTATACLLGLLISLCSHAEITRIQASSAPTTQQHMAQSPQLPPIVPSIQVPANSWALLSYNSGQILASHDANEQLPPASLTKLMTAYVTLQAVKQGRIHLDDIVTVSTKAARTGGSRMFLKVGEKVSVENLLKGMIIESGNDAAVALAEHVAGNESAFAHLMNHTALRLGMTHSHFENANGLPAENQYTSAHDMALLARALIAHFPEEYRWYSQTSFTWNGITQHSRNILMRRNPNVDGLKTGYTKAAQYCLVASQHDGSDRMIAVVMGAKSPQVRADAAQKLLTFGLRFFKNHALYQANQTIESVDIANGKQSSLQVGVGQTMIVTTPTGHYNQLQAQAQVAKNLKAPIKAGQQVGTVTVSLDQKPIKTIPLIAMESVAQGSWWHRIFN